MTAQSAWTIGRLIEWSTAYLKEHGSPSPRLDAELLLAKSLDLTRIQLYTGWDKPLNSSEREPFRKGLQRRASGEPVAYITGLKEFMGLSLAVSRDVLIPRPDTEVLVEAALADARQRLQRSDGSALRILDVGTGSGCIALACASALTGAEVEAWDLSTAALAQAKANAERLGINTLRLLQQDALEASCWTEAKGEPGFDLILSNPPYIGNAEAKDLPVSVVDFEPAAALFAGEDGLDFYRVFAALAHHRLKPGGAIFVEIGATQKAAVLDLFAQHGWQDLKVLRDYDKHERVITAARP